MVVVDSAGKISLFADFLCGCSLLAQKNHYFCTWKLALPHFRPSEATFHCGHWRYAQIFGDKSLNFALNYIKLPLNTTLDILIINVLTICAVRDHIPLKEGLRLSVKMRIVSGNTIVRDHIPLQEGLFQCTIFGVIRGRLAVAGIGMVIEAVKRDIGSDPVSRFAASFPLLRCLSVASPPPFRCFTSFPLLRHLSVVTRGQTPCCQPRFARWHIGSDPCRSLLLPAASCRLLVATQGALSCSVRHGV